MVLVLSGTASSFLGCAASGSCGVAQPWCSQPQYPLSIQHASSQGQLISPLRSHSGVGHQSRPVPNQLGLPQVLPIEMAVPTLGVPTSELAQIGESTISVQLRVPETYTTTIAEELSSDALSEWWTAFMNPKLTEILSLAEGQFQQVGMGISLDAETQPLELALIHTPQAKQHLRLHDRQQYLAATAIQYFRVVESQKSLELANLYLRRSKQLLQSAYRRFQQGEIGVADVILAKAAVSECQALRISKERDWADEFSRLRLLVGLQVSPEVIGDAIAVEFTNPSMIDVGAPSHLLQRRQDLVAIQVELNNAAMTGNRSSDSLNSAGHHELLVQTCQRSIDSAYAEAQSALDRLDELANEKTHREQAVKALTKAYELLLEQYALDRAKIAEVISLQSRWFENGCEYIGVERELLVKYAQLYAAVGGGHGPVTNYMSSELSLSSPEASQIEEPSVQIFAPSVQNDQLGNGTVTTITLGRPMRTAVVR